MTDLQKKFSAAAKMISFEENSVRKCVYCAYYDHLSDINADDLPEKIKIFYESVKIRLTSIVPHGNIDNKEATYLAKDILYMADVVRKHTEGNI